MHVLVMAKAPVAGRVKTRLCPPCSSTEAAAVAEAALADTLEAVAGCGADHKLLALDGRPGPWLPPGLKVFQQEGVGLDRRLAHAWGATRSVTGGWGIQIGMDTPQVTAGELDGLLDLLSARQGRRRNPRPAAVLGGAVDGGWWVIGLAGTDPRRVFLGVPISQPCTGQAQAQRLVDLGLDVAAAPIRRDIDTVADLLTVAEEIPASRTAAVCRALSPAWHPSRLAS